MNPVRIPRLVAVSMRALTKAKHCEAVITEETSLDLFLFTNASWGLQIVSKD